MKRLPVLLSAIVGCLLLMGAEGCSSDPNVEGAKLDLRNKDYDRALENIDTALEKTPDNAEALELKGRILSEKAFATEDPDAHAALLSDMVQAFNRAVQIDPTMAEAIGRNKAIAYVNEFQRGIQSFNKGRDDVAAYGLAAGYFGNAAMIQPDSAGAYVNQAYSYLNGEMGARAIGPFEKALAAGDTEIDTYRFLASLYLANDRVDDAVALLEKVVADHPNNVDVQAELLNAYQMAGQIDRALERYAVTVAADPTNKLYRYNYGSLLVQSERYDEAIEQLKEAIAIDSEYANAQYNLGAAYINQAVSVNEEVSRLDDELREQRADLSSADIKEREAEIDRLVDKRRGLFADAIPPLAKAQALFEASGESATAVCQALYQAYVQTNQIDMAQGVSACAGYDEN